MSLKAKISIISASTLAFVLFQNFALDTTTVILQIESSTNDSLVTTKVNYLRGFVANLDKDDATAGVGLVASRENLQATNSNFIGEVLDLNIEENRELFTYNDKNSYPNKLIPSNSEFLKTAMATANFKTPFFDRAPNLIQISGTPSAVPLNWLDNINYVAPINSEETEFGNVYYLPNNVGKNLDHVQNAIAEFIKKHESIESLSGNIWAGTQEPSHTLGYDKNQELTTSDDTNSDCVNLAVDEDDQRVRALARLECKKRNITRYINYWKPIAKKLKNTDYLPTGVKLGALQLNGRDRDLYAWSAQEIVNQQMPIDYFTLQRYGSSGDLMTRIREAYNIFKNNPQKGYSYNNVKILFNRCSFEEMDDEAERNNFLATTAGMTRFLKYEKELMVNADMIYGYLYATAGLTTPNTLLKPMMKWLQAAPESFRTVTSIDTFGKTVSSRDVESFALVRIQGAKKAYMAIWNTSTTLTKERVQLRLNPVHFKDKSATIVRGTGNAYQQEANQTIDAQGNITILNLEPETFVLVSVE